MGWIIEVIIDWFVIGFVDKLWRRLPPWGCPALIALLVAAIAGLIWLVN